MTDKWLLPIAMNTLISEMPSIKAEVRSTSPRSWRKNALIDQALNQTRDREVEQDQRDQEQQRGERSLPIGHGETQELAQLAHRCGGSPTWYRSGQVSRAQEWGYRAPLRHTGRRSAPMATRFWPEMPRECGSFPVTSLACSMQRMFRVEKQKLTHPKEERPHAQFRKTVSHRGRRRLLRSE